MKMESTQEPKQTHLLQCNNNVVAKIINFFRSPNIHQIWPKKAMP